MAYLFATAMLYLSCVLFFHAEARRTWVEPLKSSIVLRRLGWVGGGVASMAAFLILTVSAGLELAIPYLLGIIALVGALSLFVSASARGWHIPSAIISASMALLSGAGLLMEVAG